MNPLYESIQIWWSFSDRRKVQSIQIWWSKKIAIFCDSEFWHGYDWDHRKEDIKSNKEFWIPKIERNIQRDKEVNERLLSEGWTVLRFYGKDILKSTDDCVEQIIVKGGRGGKIRGVDIEL